jgi:opacity protein-like surface antigen
MHDSSPFRRVLCTDFANSTGTDDHLNLILSEEIMRKFLVTAGLLAAVAAPMQAQTPGTPVTSGQSSFYVSPYVGYVWYGDLFTMPNQVEFSNDDGVNYGVQAGVSFSPNFSLIGNFGYNKSKFVWESDITGDQITASGDLGIFFYDANLQFRLPFIANQTGSWLAPVGQVGVGAMKYTFDTDDFNSDGDTNVAFNFGLGADFQLTKALGARVMIKDYITSLAWTDVDSVDFDDDVDNNVAHNWALTFGLNFGF